MSCRIDPKPLRSGSGTDSVHTDLARLGRILHWGSLPPGSATYRIQVHGSESDLLPGPTDWTIEAILRYDTATFSRLEPLRTDQDRLPEPVPSPNPPWGWLDSADRSLLRDTPPQGAQDNHLFPIEGCPFGKLQVVPPSTLLFWCSTR
ncbi:MAG: hypothetical protein IPN71_21135 [Fibrobacteres bacterium]|nr:hypothetical protein [Fibrobacterota bacterium]